MIRPVPWVNHTVVIGPMKQFLLFQASIGTTAETILGCLPWLHGCRPTGIIYRLSRRVYYSPLKQENTGVSEYRLKKDRDFENSE